MLESFGSGVCAFTALLAALRLLNDRQDCSICCVVCWCIMREYEDMATVGSDS